MKVCLACEYPFDTAGWHCPACGHSPTSERGYLVFAPELVHGDGSDAQYKYQELFDAEAENFWFRARNELIIWALSRYFAEAQNFLEVGCGTGFVLSGIQQARPDLALFASEILITGLTYAQERLPTATIFQMDALRIPFKAEFDVIGAFDVLEHIDADEAALREIHHALRPQDGLLLTVPQHPFLWSYQDEFSHHKRRYTRAELVAKVENAGFEVLYVTSFVAVLLPLLMLSRWQQRDPGPDHDPMAEMKISSTLNTLLEKSLAVERFLLKRGITFPAGGSLLLVGRRL